MCDFVLIRVYDRNCHLTAFDTGLLEKDKELFASGYLKPVYEEDVSWNGNSFHFCNWYCRVDIYLTMLKDVVSVAIVSTVNVSISVHYNVCVIVDVKYMMQM